MGKDVIRETFWDPANPNRLALTLRGGVKVMLLCIVLLISGKGNMDFYGTSLLDV